MTSNDGFSVVAVLINTNPSSTWGRIASCCALLKRWISSMKSTVRRPARRWTLASATTFLRSATPAVTADMATIRALVSVARRRARVVLPLPGGPQSTMLGRLPERVSRRRTSTTFRWPTRSSKLFGRILVASGGRGSEPSGRGKSSPWSVMTELWPSALEPRFGGPMTRIAAHGHLLVLQLGAPGDLPVLSELRPQPDRPDFEPPLRGRRPHHGDLELQVHQRPDRPGGQPGGQVPPAAFRAGRGAGPRRAHTQGAPADPDRRPPARDVRAPRPRHPRHRHRRVPGRRRPPAFRDRAAGDRRAGGDPGGGQDQALDRLPRLLDQRRLAADHRQLRRGHCRRGPRPDPRGRADEPPGVHRQPAPRGLPGARVWAVVGDEPDLGRRT